MCLPITTYYRGPLISTGTYLFLRTNPNHAIARKPRGSRAHCFPERHDGWSYKYVANWQVVTTAVCSPLFLYTLTKSQLPRMWMRCPYRANTYLLWDKTIFNNGLEGTVLSHTLYKRGSALANLPPLWIDLSPMNYSVFIYQFILLYRDASPTT